MKAHKKTIGIFICVKLFSAWPLAGFNKVLGKPYCILMANRSKVVDVNQPNERLLIMTTVTSFSKKASMAALLCGALATTGCASMNSLQDTTVDTLGTTVGGAVVGAGFGAGLGVGVAALLSSNPWTGAIIGAGVGLLAGGAGGAFVADEINEDSSMKHHNSSPMVTR